MKPNGSEGLKELLCQALETEMGGVKVYRTALRCAVNQELKEEWEEYLEQTENHERIVRELFEHARASIPRRRRRAARSCGPIGGGAGRGHGEGALVRETGRRAARRLRVRGARRRRRTTSTGS